MWLEVHQSLQRHPKLLRLSAKLRIHKAQSAGHLLFLWLWTLDYAPTGDLSAFGPAEISAAAECSFDAELFVQALRETGWIDEDGKLHDWHEYAGKLLDKREADRERKAAERRSPKGVQKTSAGHPPDGAGTVPNRTVPNITIKPPPAARSRIGKPKGENPIPTEVAAVYDFYRRHFSASARKADALKWIERRGREHGFERLIMCINLYRLEATEKKTEAKFYKDCANFFGEDAAFEVHLPDPEFYAKYLARAQSELNGGNHAEAG